MIDYNNFLSKTSAELEPSGIRKFFDVAANMENVISFGIGEPDFITPWNIRDQAIAALQDGYTSYTVNAGLLELREEIANYINRKIHVTHSPDDKITVTVGASQSIDLAFQDFKPW